MAPSVWGMSSPAAFQLSVYRDRGELRLAPSGELDLYTGPELRSAAAAVTGPARGGAVIDLAGLTFIDVAGMRAVADALTTLRTRGYAARLETGSSPAQRLFKLVDFELLQSGRPAGRPGPSRRRRVGQGARTRPAAPTRPTGAEDSIPVPQRLIGGA